MFVYAELTCYFFHFFGFLNVNVVLVSSVSCFNAFFDVYDVQDKPDHVLVIKITGGSSKIIVSTSQKSFTWVKFLSVNSRLFFFKQEKSKVIFQNTVFILQLFSSMKFSFARILLICFTFLVDARCTRCNLCLLKAVFLAIANEVFH